MGQQEKIIENAILEYLWMKGVFCWKQQTIGVYDSKKKTYRKRSKFQLAGISDILGILPNGTFFAIEVKTFEPKKYASPDQKEFIKKVNECFGAAFVARSIDDVIKGFAEYGIIL
jgi:hypothetical protein